MTTQRALFEDADYWREQIAFLNKSIRRFAKLAVDKAQDDELRVRGLRLVCSRRLDLLRAQYSAGLAPKVMAGSFEKLVEAVAEYYADPAHDPETLELIDGYVTHLSRLSLGILLGAPEEQLEVVARAAGKPGRDGLFDQLAASVVDGWRVGRKLLHPRPFQPLHDAFTADDADEAGERVVDFLQKYYPGMKDAYFYNTHLKKDAGFVGYWSFECAAVVVLREIDDSGFSDNLYYPADLADHARKRRR